MKIHVYLLTTANKIRLEKTIGNNGKPMGVIKYLEVLELVVKDVRRVKG